MSNTEMKNKTEQGNDDRLGYSRKEKIRIDSLYGALAAFTIFCFICAREKIGGRDETRQVCNVPISVPAPITEVAKTTESRPKKVGKGSKTVENAGENPSLQFFSFKGGQ